MLRAKLSEADFRLFPSAPLFVPASLMRSKHTIRKAGAVVLARCGPTFLTLTLLTREPASKHTRDVESSFAVRSQERQSYTFFYGSFFT